MAMTHEDCRKLFGKFISFNKMLSNQVDDENYYGLSYRMDTFQLWAECPEQHLPSSRMLCGHAGLHMAIVPDEHHYDKSEFAIMMGPFDLMRGSDPELLFRQMVKSVKAVMATSQLHIHALGYPCHDDCECEQILAEENYYGP
jgi:hypothetical protein|tara:strand:+ start:166 stop:594 length:429 start_codon:yes stop_codon:yes gene_type:complete